MELLRLIDVTKTYKVGDNERHALRHFSFDFPNYGLIAIVGKSGCGKSTLLNLISLIDKPSSGDIYYGNENILKWNNKRINLYRGKELGFIYQSYHLIESESTFYNIMLPALIAGESEKKAKDRTSELLKSINFRKSLYKQKACDLSGGEKERVAILRALINDPKIILADEPTGALDSSNSEIVMDILKKISEKKLVIMVSHNLSLVKRYADKVIVLKDGKIDSIYRDMRFFSLECL